ncbi:hypothetical protein [Aeromonas veronii]|uniref:hypothetical protein n=1 Tax=Aeromonas veronii TaxID=654 RepID=UPI003D23BFE5
MNPRLFRKRSDFCDCESTEIEDDLLEALLVNKRQTSKYKNISPLLYNGHGQHCQARQVLSYLMRKGLGVVRRPGTYDIELNSLHFNSFTNDELNGAVKDIQRIYSHTQREMKKHAHEINLVRGIDGIEASVCAKLIDESYGDKINYYFQTITFFNHVCSAFHRQLKISINCPVDWVWASIYTLKDLELPGDDEEFIIICKSDDGTIEIPKKNIERTASIFEIDKVIEPKYNNTKYPPKHLHQAISALMVEGFEPDNFERYISQYKEGLFEKKMMTFGRWLDSKLSEFNKSKIIVRSKEKSYF